ncbi:MAG: IS110 family transposase [Gammaproteobacteria bacterium]
MKLYCGIDLHSNNSLISVINEADKVVFEKRLANDLVTIRHALQPYQDARVGVVVESTYNWYWLVDGLKDAGFDVRLANTVAMKQYNGLKHTDDKTDARYLAHLFRLGILPEGYVYPYDIRCVRDVLRRRLLMVRQRVAQHLSLQSLIARHTSKRLTGPQVRKLAPEDIRELLMHPSAQLSAQLSHELITTLSGAIERIERNVAVYCQPTQDYNLITSVTGIGPMIGQSILLETGPIGRFSSVNDYASYARCVPSNKISNGKKKGEGNRKNGNKYLEYAFMEAAHYAAIWEPRIKRYYQRKASRTHKMVAKKAIANKLAKACYHMITRNESFDVNRAFV